MKLGSLVGGAATVIGPEANLGELADVLVRESLGSLGVIVDRRLVGIITERDLVRAIAAGADPETELVADWMSEAPDVFPPETDVAEAGRWLLEVGYRHMPVMADGELLGIVSIRDLLWALLGEDDTPSA